MFLLVRRYTDHRTDPTLLAKVPTGLFIGGRWEAAAGGVFDVVDPATGNVIVQVADGSPQDAIRALDAAVAAQAEWAATAPRVRGEILRRAWELVQERAGLPPE